MNINLDHIGEYRLEIKSANLMKSEPEFCKTKALAKARKKELWHSGYTVTVFKVTETGGLEFA